MLNLNGLPVNIQKAAQKLPLAVHQVIRTIPDRRYVCFGTFNHQAVYAKIFVGKSATHYALRDKAGVEALQQAQLLTPQLLLARELGRGAYILIYAAIEDSQNAEQVWQQLEAPQRFSLMQKLLQTVALHHQAGLLQTDLHLKNFLVQSHSGQADLIYTLDGDGIRHLSLLFHKRQKLHNLATLFSKMDVLDDVRIAELYQLYCSQLGMVSSLDGEAEVWFQTQKIRHQVATGYADKKVFRNCTDVKVTQNFRQFVAITAGFNVEKSALASLDQHLADAQRNIKNGNTCTIAKAALAGRQVIIKRYNIKNFWHGLNRAVRVSRAAKSWANAHRLIISNVATAAPLALVEQRLGCLRRRAYFLTEYVDAPDAMQFFSQSTQLADKKTVARNLATLFYKLYLLKYSHGDCKATNIKIVNSAPVLIDLDAMKVHFGGILGDWYFGRKHIKDLQRFMKNWENDMETTNLLKQALHFAYTSSDVYAGDNILIRAGID